MTDKPKFECINRTTYATVYRSVVLEPVGLPQSASPAEIRNWHKWKLSQYTPTNHIRKVVFSSREACAEHIDSMLDHTTTNDNGETIYWTVRAGCLRWFAK